MISVIYQPEGLNVLFDPLEGGQLVEHTVVAGQLLALRGQEPKHTQPVQCTCSQNVLTELKN